MTLATRIRSFFSSLGGSTRPDRPDHVNLPRSVVLCAPNYGNKEVFNILGRILDGIRLPKGVKVSRAIGQNVSRLQISRILDGARGTNTIKIFAGHGVSEALLGPFHEGCIAVTSDKEKFANIFDSTLIKEPISLFAFCCSSAKSLGKKFNGPQQTYLGFGEKIGVDLSNGECINTWTSLIQGTAEKIIHDGFISDTHKEQLLGLYDDAISYFKDGNGKNNNRNFTMLFYLKKQREVISNLGGPPKARQV